MASKTMLTCCCYKYCLCDSEKLNYFMSSEVDYIPVLQTVDIVMNQSLNVNWVLNLNLGASLATITRMVEMMKIYILMVSE
jgi:hypothetical protein